MATGKTDLLKVLHSALADVERFKVDAQRRDFDAISYEYAIRILSEIEQNLRQCIEKAEGL
ncbi:MAG: hypothetical protein N2316_08225 [Spirochaetes bacterium]|nr:hypothetical protein [Spirochaetota bacterium]